MHASAEIEKIKDDEAIVATGTEATEAKKAGGDLIPTLAKLHFYVFTCGLGALQTGWAITGNTQTAPVFIVKFGWDEDEAKIYNTLISSVSILGIAIGSLLGGLAVQKGRRRAIFIFDLMTICGSVICQYLSVPTLCLGRFICGLAAGVLNIALSKSIIETVPEQYTGLFGSFSNFYIAFGVMLATVTGAVLPHDKAYYMDTEMWRFVYACPIIICIVQILLFTLYWKEEPINFSVANGNDAQAKSFMARVFKTPSASTPEETDAAFDNYIADLRKNSNQDVSKVPFKDAVCHPLYRRATWVCFTIGVFNMQTGLNAVNVYMHRLMDIVKALGDFPMTANTATVICGVTDFTGGVFAIFLMHKFGRKSMLIFGHAMMGLMELGAGAFFQANLPGPMYLCLNGFILSFSMTSGPVTWLYISECTVDTATGLVVLGLYTSCMQQVLSMEFLMGSANFGLAGTFYLFGFENFLCVIFLILFVKETRGHTDAEKKMLYVSKETQEKYGKQTDSNAAKVVPEDK
jgi:MFS family permease